jgi:hypothetical protein
MAALDREMGILGLKGACVLISVIEDFHVHHDTTWKTKQAIITT